MYPHANASHTFLHFLFCNCFSFFLFFFFLLQLYFVVVLITFLATTRVATGTRVIAADRRYVEKHRLLQRVTCHMTSCFAKSIRIYDTNSHPSHTILSFWPTEQLRFLQRLQGTAQTLVRSYAKLLKVICLHSIQCRDCTFVSKGDKCVKAMKKGCGAPKWKGDGNCDDNK